MAENWMDMSELQLSSVPGETNKESEWQYEDLQTDRVRYLRGIGMKIRLKRDHNITAVFPELGGNTKLKLNGQQHDIEKARQAIKKEQGISRWYLLPEKELKAIRFAKGADIIQRLKDHRICVGWNVSLKTSKLFIHGKNLENVESGLGVFLAMTGLSRDDIQQPSHPRSRQALQRSRDDSLPQCPSQPRRRGMSTGRRDRGSKPQGSDELNSLIPSHDSLHLPKVTDELENLEMEKLTFLRATLGGFIRSTSEEFSVSINVDARKSSIELTGTHLAVAAAKEKVKAYLDSLCIHVARQSPEFISCLSKEVRHSEMIEALKRAQVRVGWDIREQRLWMCGDSKPKVEKAESVICGLITEGIYPNEGCLTDEQKQGLVSKSGRWKPYKEQLVRDYPDLHIGLNSDLSQIVFAVKDKDTYHTIMHSLDMHFAQPETHHSEIQISEDLGNLLRAYKAYAEKKCKHPSDDRVIFDVSNRLKCVISSMSPRSISLAGVILKAFTLDRLSMDVEWKVQFDWMKTEEGAQRLNEICKKSHTLAEIVNMPVPVPALRLSLMDKVNGLQLPQTTNLSATGNLADKIELIVGDISKTPKENNVSGIFCSQGATEQAIRSLVTPNRPFQAGFQRFADSDVYFTRLHERREDNSHIEHLKREVEAALYAFSANRVRRVAFPAVGTGNLKYSTRQVADAMIDTVESFLTANPRTYIEKVYIVVYFDDERSLQRFQSKLGKLKTKNGPHSDMPQYSGISLSATPTTTSVKRGVSFVGFQLSDVNDAISSLKKEMNKLIQSDDWSNSPQKKWIRNISAPQRSELNREASVNDVKIRFTDDNIFITGSPEGNKKIRGRVDQILLKSIDSGGISALPPTWDLVKMKDDYAEVKLSRYLNSDEYAKVSVAFERTSGGGVTIHEITRIQNKHLYLQYQSQVKKVKLEIQDSIQAERQLWHGSDLETVKQICQSEFNRSFAGKNAVAYGQGCYFATTSKYSIRFATDTGYKYMIMAKVATGRYRLGNSDKTRKNLGAEYHSTVDNTTEPKIYVVYHDAAAYPEYVIKFTKESQP